MCLDQCQLGLVSFTGDVCGFDGHGSDGLYFLKFGIHSSNCNVHAMVNPPDEGNQYIIENVAIESLSSA